MLPLVQIERLRRLLPHDQIVHTTSDEEFRAALPDVDALFATWLTAGDLARAPRLRWIQSSAVGVKTIVTPELIDFYVPMARGGTPLIITGNIYVSRDGKSTPRQAGVDGCGRLHDGSDEGHRLDRLSFDPVPSRGGPVTDRSN